MDTSRIEGPPTEGEIIIRCVHCGEVAAWERWDDNAGTHERSWKPKYRWTHRGRQPRPHVPQCPNGCKD